MYAKEARMAFIYARGDCNVMGHIFGHDVGPYGCTSSLPPLATVHRNCTRWNMEKTLD